VIDLHCASREELLEEVSSLRAKTEAQDARIAELEEEIRRLRGGKGGGTPLAIKPSRPEQEVRKERKHRDRGYARRLETQVDERREHAVEQCPECGRKLEGGWEHARRQVIEVVLQKRVVEHVFVARRCGVCQQRRLPPVEACGLGVQGQRRFGASVQALVAWLHIEGRTPLRTIRKLLREGCDLHISTGEVLNLLEGVREAGESTLEDLLKQLRSAPAVCADETGWREDGQNGYLWGFFTQVLRYYLYQKSRAGQVPKDLLGEDFPGTVTCDFYAGYNDVAVLQRCWPHLLRDAKDLAKLNADRPEVGEWVQALGDLYREAKEVSSPRLRDRRKARRIFEQRAAELARPYAKHPEAPQRVLSERILKHLHELFVFVEDPQVPGDNNLAERSLRPAVIARKISGGTRSAEGSKRRTGLMSLFGTWSAQGKSTFSSCRELLLSTRAP
jgi:hypothetical protein